MKQNKYLNIRMDGETNIGVIDMGVVYTNNKKTIKPEMDSELRQRVEGKLVEALQSHFDCPVKIIFPHVEQMNPIKLKVDIIICSDEEDYQETVYLEETWLY